MDDDRVPFRFGELLDRGCEGQHIFPPADGTSRFGYAMAEVWLQVAVILIFSIYQMRALRTGQLKMHGN